MGSPRRVIQSKNEKQKCRPGADVLTSKYTGITFADEPFQRISADRKYKLLIDNRLSLFFKRNLLLTPSDVQRHVVTTFRLLTGTIRI